MSYKVFRLLLKTIYFRFIRRIRTRLWYFTPHMDLNGRIPMAYFTQMGNRPDSERKIAESERETS